MEGDVNKTSQRTNGHSNHIDKNFTDEMPKTKRSSRTANNEKHTPQNKKRSISPPQQPRSSKRQRLQYQPFQSPGMAHVALGKGGRSEEKVTIFFKGEFLALRNEIGSFFVCQAAQNVYKSSRRFKIRWLSRMDTKDDDLYTPDFYDFTDFECVLTNLRMDRMDKNVFRLPKSEISRTENILRRALNLENGINEPELEQVEQDGVDVSMVSDESPPKKTKIEHKISPSVGGRSVLVDTPRAVTRRQAKQNEIRVLRSSTIITNNKKKISTRVKMKPTFVKVKTKVVKENPEAKELTPKKEAKFDRTNRSRKSPSREKLKPNNRVSVLNKDPTFESNANIPVVSVAAYSKLPIRAVLTKDTRLLQSLINDTAKVCSLHEFRSVDQPLDALAYALLNENHKAIQLLLKEILKPSKKRVQVPESLLVHRTTGRYIPQFLGHAIKDITISRGSKEGNNALIKDSQSPFNEYEHIRMALERGVSKQTLEVYFTVVDKETNQSSKQIAIPRLHHAVRYGHRRLAGQFVEDALKMDGFGFNNLHKEVLLFDKQELSACRPASVKKKALPPFGLTPLHCAAINPNPKYLSTLLSIEPEFQITDKSMRRPIHYAAACEGTGPLDFLLSKGIRTDDTDNDGNTPLHIAADSGRAQNVELILKRARAEKKVLDNNVKDHGLAGLNRPNKLSWTPLHLACTAGHIDVVRVLLKYNADVEKPSSAGKHKLTALMLACQQGHLDIMKLLVQYRAKIETKDKFKRTALTHAVINGHAHIASHLLRLGADPNTSDSSGNTVTHYAAAYGWWFCLKLLLESGAKPNIPNEWTLTPLGVAFLKGHMGLVDLLLEQPGVDVNFKDEKGLSLLMLAVSSPLSQILVEQVQYLLEELKADCTSLDPQKNTAYHWLACNSVHRHDGMESKICPDAVAASLEIAKLLLAFGCDPSIRNEAGQTALTLAIEKGNNELVKLLLRDGCQVTAEVDDTGENLLHNLVEHAWETDLASLICIIKDSVPNKKTKKQAEENSEITVSKPTLPFLYIMEGNFKTGDAVQIKGSCSSSSEGFTILLLKGESPEEDDVILRLMLQPVDSFKKMNITRASRVAGEWVNEQKDEIVPSVTDGQVTIDLTITAQKDLQISLGGNVLYEFSPAVTFDKASHIHLSGNVSVDSLQIKKALIPPTKNSSSGCPAEVLLEMAQTYSYDGFTPLLLACKKYHHATEKKQQIRLREMIKSLIEEADSEIHAVVKKRSDEKARPIDGYSVLHFLASAKEVNGNAPETLQLVLTYKPPLNIRDNRGRTPLITAILSRQSAAAEALINAGADVNLFSEDEEEDGKASPLILAAKLGLVQVTKLLLKNRINVTSVDQKNLNTALHYAVCLKTAPESLEVVQLLVQAGVKVNSTNKEGLTPLHLAVNSCTGSTDDSVEIEDYLIENGANLFAKDSFGRIPLHYAFVKLGNKDIVTEGENENQGSIRNSMGSERSYESSTNKSRKQQTDSTKIDPIEVVSLLASAMKNNQLDCADNSCQTPLHCAAFRGATICCMRLSKKMANVNAVDKNGNTALSLAILGGHESCAIMLLQGGASIQGNVVVPLIDMDNISNKKERLFHSWQWKCAAKNTSKTSQNPILQEVASKDWQGVMYMMLDQLHAMGNNYFPAVEAALNTNKYRLALSLIARIKETSKLKTCNSSGQNFLHILALKAKVDQQVALQIKVAEFLVQRGLSLSAVDNFGSYPITYSAINRNTPLCEYFTGKMGKEAVMKAAADKLGRTPVTASFWWIRPEKWGSTSQVMSNYRTWCETVIQSSVLDTLAQYPSPMPHPGHTVYEHPSDPNDTLKQDWRMTPLIHAICSNDLDLTTYLLQHGADVNKPDSNGWSPLMHAVRMNNIIIVKTLLNYNYKESKETNKKSDENVEDSPTKLGFRTALKTKTDKFNDTSYMEVDENVDTNSENPVNGVDMETDSELFHKTSNADLTHRDKNGNTVAHIAVQPYTGASYENTVLLELLATVKAPLTEQNKSALTPLQLAAAGRFQRIIPVLQKLIGSSDNVEIPPLPKHVVEDGLKWEAPLWNYKEDSSSLIKQKEKEVVEETEDENTVKPDTQSGFEDTGEVVMDPELGIPFDALMTKVDISYGAWGRYNFYKLQIIKQKGKDLYILFTRWGRIGSLGQFQQTPFRNLDEAIKEFSKIFRSKSNNNWQDVKNFQPHFKKYHLVTFEKRKRHKLKDFSVNLETALPSKLPQNLQDLMKDLTNVNMLQEACRDTGIDIGVIPFGQMSEIVINKGREILLQLKDLVTEKNQLENDIEKKDKLSEICEKIIVMSNEYYQAVPQFGYAYEKVQPLDSMNDLQTCNQQIDNLAELEVTTQLLLGAQHRIREINPLDYIYRSLNCKIAQMKEDDIESQYILQYIHNTADQSNKPHVECIYKVARSDEVNNDLDIGNRWILWHGTSPANLVNILARGLQCGHPNIPPSTTHFNRGVYFSDMFDYSCRFVTHNHNSDTRRHYILLCEVALGKVKDKCEDDCIQGPQEGYDSMKIVGTYFPDPTYNVSLASGSTIPLGAKTSKVSSYGFNIERSSNCNEYIVFNRKQIRLRYLVCYHYESEIYEKNKQVPTHT